MFRINYDSDPATGRVEIIPGDLGVYNNRCTVEAEGRIYGFGAGGAWVMEGLVPRIISEPVYRKIDDGADASQSELFFAVYDPDERSVQFHYVADGDSKSYVAVAYDLDTGNLTQRNWRQALVGGFTTIDSNNFARAFVSDESGYSWFLRDGRFDGVPSTMTTGVVTSDSGASTTVIPVDETLSTSPDLKGCVLYWPSEDESRVVASNTASAITVASAFSSAPSDGDVLWLGSIRLSYITKWIGDTTKQDKRKRMQNVGIRFVPADSGSDIDVYTYIDFGTTSEIATSNSTDIYPSGVSAVPGNAYVTVDTSISVNADGYVDMPMVSEMQSHAKWEVQQYEPGGSIEIVDFMPIIDGKVKNLQ